MEKHIYNVSQFTKFLKKNNSMEAMAENFKNKVPNQKERNWFMEHYKTDILHYGRDFKNAFSLTVKQNKDIRELVFGTKKTVRVTHY